MMIIQLQFDLPISTLGVAFPLDTLLLVPAVDPLRFSLPLCKTQFAFCILLLTPWR